MYFLTSRKISLPEIGVVNIIKSRKYRRITIRVTSKKIRVTIPYQVNFKQAEDFLYKNINWVKDKYKEMSKDIQFYDNQEIKTLFGNIKLHFVESKKNEILKKESEIHCFINKNKAEQNEYKEVYTYLLKLIKKEAKQYLVERIKYLAEKKGLKYSKIILSSANGRWGSCSSKNSISLNYRLVFLPSCLCDYVILHELAHTIHKNHSKDFWNFLTQIDPKSKEHRKLLKKYRISEML